MGSTKRKKNTVFVSGIFHVLHPGHFRLFRFAAELADKVIVGLIKKESSPFDMAEDTERMQAMSLVSLVDEVILVDDVMQAIVELQPDIVLKGSEFKHQYNPEVEVLERWQGQLVFASGESYFSGSKLSASDNTVPAIPFPEEYQNFIRRHNISGDGLRRALAGFGQQKVAVIGDIILDEYVDCDPVGLSREDPTIVVTPVDSKRFVGGAAIVAQHTQSLGAKVDFYSVSGEDSNADWVRDMLAGAGMSLNIYQDPSRPTTTKKRFRSDNKTLLRVNEYRNHPLAENLRKRLLRDFEQAVSGYDLVVFSDFNYGLLTPDTVKHLQEVASNAVIPMVADSQTSSQRGDLCKFSNLLLATPTEIEARLAVDIESREVGLAKVIEETARRIKAQNLIITLGADGALILDNSVDAIPKLDSLTALNKNPVDVAGAGDVLLVTTSLSKICGVDIWHAAILGMLSSGIHIGGVGNSPIQIESLLSYVEKLNP